MTDRGIVLVTILALVAASLAAEAQPGEPLRTIGIVAHGPARSFEDGLREGKNVRFERSMSTDNQTLSHFAAELIRTSGRRYLCRERCLLVKDEARYSNAPASESYLVRGATRDFGDYLRLVVGKVNYSYASELEKALRGDRKPSAPGYYTSWYSSPEDAEQFTSAQHRGFWGPAAVLARRIELGGRRQLLDVGGGSGAFTIALCRRNPDLTATILDFPETVAVARRFVTEAGLQGRVRHLAGNALHVDWPGAQDAVLMSYVWSAVGRSEVEELARRAYTALRSGGTVLIHDFMADDDLRGPSNAAFHLLLSALDTQEMALLTPSLVRERLARVDFTGTTASTLLPGITNLVIGYKA